MNIAVGLSGGVDSSVAAALLARAGHRVCGVTMTLWREGKYRGGDRDACFGPGEAADCARAARVCAALRIPHHVFDCAEEYEKIVLAYFRAEYLAGRTPNPCVRCNGLMKFGVLLAQARAAGLCFDKFATGHYVRNGERDGRQFLQMARDRAKDQSYFLYRLSQTQIGGARFPLGEMTKNEVRAVARELGLETGDLPDSQDFYSGDHRELLGAPDREGDIIDACGKVVGKHRGYWHYTIGQRKGLGVSAKQPLYVVALDAERNAVIVGSAAAVKGRAFQVDDLHWVAVAAPNGAFNATVRIRSSATPVAAKISPASDGKWQVETATELNAIAPGQSAVFYDDDLVMGGGRILRSGAVES
ncbi:tRNA-specific 2-thiouridylase MnmA [Planctomycetales bacterium]|nr:tRNA-specific 2-thiouridylase MnmA [Planctomycetales bacterium]